MNDLFEYESHDWTREWISMPDFVQEKQIPHKELKIRFATQEDYESFQKLIGQKLTMKTKSLWHPILERGKYSHLTYENEP